MTLLRKRKRGRALALLVCAFALIAAVAGTGIWLCQKHAPGEEPHTVIVVLVDTLRRDALGCYGNPEPVTPQMDAIAAEGVKFEHAVSTSGWTLPAVASLLTGTWPTLHGAMGKGVSLTPIRDEIPTAAELFRENAYRTFAVANAAFVSPTLHLDRGFEVFDHRYAYNWEIRRADESIDTALEWLRANSAEPGFVFIHLFDPHLNYDPPPGCATSFTHGRNTPPPPLSHQYCTALAERNGGAPPAEDIAYIRAVYHGEVNFVDAQIGRLAAALKEMGIYGRTTLVITADHGEEFWDHGGFEHGHTLYGELTEIPLLIKPPNAQRASVRAVDAQVRIVDILPTLFDLTGLEAPASFAGTSLVPYFDGQATGDLMAFSESTLYGNDKLSWRTERYKYIVSTNPDASRQGTELFDWREDPEERNNLIATHPEIARELGAQFAAFYKDLWTAARSMSQPEVKDLNPRLIESLDSLGYLR